jgi:hypothetical protein
MGKHPGIDAVFADQDKRGEGIADAAQFGQAAGIDRAGKKRDEVHVDAAFHIVLGGNFRYFLIGILDHIVLPVVVVAEFAHLERHTNRFKKRVHIGHRLPDLVLRDVGLPQTVAENVRHNGEFFIQARQRFVLKPVTLGVQATGKEQNG